LQSKINWTGARVN